MEVLKVEREGATRKAVLRGAKGSVLAPDPAGQPLGGSSWWGGCVESMSLSLNKEVYAS